MIDTIKVRLDEKAQRSKATWVAFSTSAGSYELGIAYWARVDLQSVGCRITERDNGSISTPGHGKVFGLTPNQAARAFDLMVGFHGMRWHERADAHRYDEAIQRLMFGELVYG